MGPPGAIIHPLPIGTDELGELLEFGFFLGRLVDHRSPREDQVEVLVQPIEEVPKEFLGIVLIVVLELRSVGHHRVLQGRRKKGQFQVASINKRRRRTRKATGAITSSLPSRIARMSLAVI